MTEPDQPESMPSEGIESPPPLYETVLPGDGVVLEDTPVVRPVPQPPAGPAQPPATPLKEQADEPDGEH